MATVVYIGPDEEFRTTLAQALKGLAEVVDQRDPRMMTASIALVDSGGEALEHTLEGLQYMGIPAIVVFDGEDDDVETLLKKGLVAGFTIRTSDEVGLRVMIGLLARDLRIA